MILALEIILLIGGIYTLATGRLTLSKNRILTGTMARVAGVIMVLPLPLAFSLVLLFRNSISTDTAVILEIAIVGICLVAALVIGYTMSSKRPA